MTRHNERPAFTEAQISTAAGLLKKATRVVSKHHQQTDVLPQLIFSCQPPLGAVWMIHAVKVESCHLQSFTACIQVFFTGAGMSADSGIATFRASSSGFWGGITVRIPQL